MKIKFLSDFRGRETGEQFFCAGQIAEVDVETAERLINDERAELIPSEIPEVVANEKPAETPLKKGKRK